MEDNTNQIAAEGIPEKPKTNPYNQHNPDPRRILAWNLYIDVDSDTFSNGYASAIKAGYSESAARQITCSPWWVEKCRRKSLLDKAERNLADDLDLDVGKYGILEESKLRTIRQRTTHFVAERLGKDVYSSRNELTGKDGERIVPPLDDAQRGKLDALLAPEDADSDS